MDAQLLQGKKGVGETPFPEAVALKRNPAKGGPERLQFSGRRFIPADAPFEEGH